MRTYQKSDIHWQRKIWHMIGVLFVWAIFKYFPENLNKFILIGFALFSLSVELGRRKSVKFNKFILSLMLPFMRKQEIKGVAGTTPLLVGAALISLIFEKDVTQVSLLMLAFADPIASYFGIKYGTLKILGAKSLQGTLAAFFICSTVSYFAFSSQWQDVLFLGVVGALAELIPVGKLDDNFSMPVLIAIMLTIYKMGLS